MTDETQHFKITLSLSLCQQSSSPDRHAKSQSLTCYCSSQTPVCSSSTLSVLKRNKTLKLLWWWKSTGEQEPHGLRCHFQKFIFGCILCFYHIKNGPKQILYFSLGIVLPLVNSDRKKHLNTLYSITEAWLSKSYMCICKPFDLWFYESGRMKSFVTHFIIKWQINQQNEHWQFSLIESRIVAYFILTFTFFNVVTWILVEDFSGSKQTLFSVYINA